MGELQRSGCRVIAVANQKGGVGKTATTTNLGAGLARMGYRVLIVDLDSQASQTVALGYHYPDDLEHKISFHLAYNAKLSQCQDYSPFLGILQHMEGLALMPSGIEMAGLEMRLQSVMARERVLDSYLGRFHEMRGSYDFILLDCPPSLGVITYNALTAADSVVIPVQPEFLSTVGMSDFLSTVAQVQSLLNPRLRIDGILITLANMRTNVTIAAVETLRETFGDEVHIYGKPIPYTVKMKEAAAGGISIFSHAPDSMAASAYGSLCEEVLDYGKEPENEGRVCDTEEVSR